MKWTGQSYEEKLAGSQATLLFGLSILIVFLVLAALYESWSIPLAVILVVPLGLLGALLAVFLRDMPNDIYFKVGLITTIGLSAKNAILIVEVAREFYREGMNAAEAAVAAAKLRLRPILMTSLAFGAGVIPLAFAHGAAAGAQRAVGTGVLGGIITATLLAIFLVPLFFRLTAGKRGRSIRKESEAGFPLRKIFRERRRNSCRPAAAGVPCMPRKRTIAQTHFESAVNPIILVGNIFFQCRHGNLMVCMNKNILMIK